MSQCIAAFRARNIKFVQHSHSTCQENFTESHYSKTGESYNGCYVFFDRKR